MALQSYASPAGRINELKGEILAHAIPVEVLGLVGQPRKHPKNKGSTVIYRRWLPRGATISSINDIVVDANAHLLQEGVTPAADTLTPQDITVQLQQYGVLYAVTDKNVDLYEDDVPEEMKVQTGERCGLLREMIRYGVLKACTNKFYAGGTSRATVDEKISLAMIRKVTKSIKAAHGKMITRILAPSPNFATAPVEAAYVVFVHTDAEPDIRDLPGFKTCSEYGSRKPMSEYEFGSCESFRFITSPDLKSIPDSGAAIGATGLFSTTGTLIDVYPFIVMGEQAYGHLALRGQDSIDPTWIPPGQKDKNDPLGQRGYVGAKFYANSVITNDGWMAVIEAGVTDV